MMKVKKYRDLFITIMSNLQKKSFNPDTFNKKKTADEFVGSLF